MGVEYRGRIPDEKIDEVRLAADIAEVVGRRVKLITAGRTLKGLCPFHGDTDPSLVVNRARGTWHCFGCNEGGNVFTFVMRDEGLSFPEAVRELARRYGVPMPKPKLSPAQQREQKHRQRLLRVLELAGKFFSQQLAAPVGAAAREYLLARRGLSPQTIEEFGLGFAPEGWEHLKRYLAAQGLDERLAMEAGVLAAGTKGRGAYDRFRDRVVFPIRDMGGRVVSFGGRILGSGEPKYLNGPESPLFRKSRMLYNLDRARLPMRRKARALVVEGYFDVITLSAHGFTEAVAPMGTALTPDQVRLLGRQADEVVVVFDSDQAGRKAAERSLPVFLSEKVTAKALLLPAGHDPDTYVREVGAAALEREVAAARPLTEVVLDMIVQRGDTATPEGKSATAAACGQVLGAIKDPVVRLEYLGRTAAALGLPRGVLARRLGLPEGDTPAAPARPAPAGPRNLAANTQSIILEGALAATEAAAALAAGGALAMVTDPELAPVAQAIEAVLDAGGQVTADRVIQTLADPAAAPVVSRLAQRAPLHDPRRAEAEARALLASLERRRPRRSRSRLQAAIAAAEAAGDLAEVARLQKQRSQMSSSNLVLKPEKD